MFAGTLVHKIAAQMLDTRYPGRSVYNPTKGVDLTDTMTGARIEIATRAQEAYKAAKYPSADVVTYEWSPW